MNCIDLTLSDDENGHLGRAAPSSAAPQPQEPQASKQGRHQHRQKRRCSGDASEDSDLDLGFLQAPMARLATQSSDLHHAGQPWGVVAVGSPQQLPEHNAAAAMRGWKGVELQRCEATQESPFTGLPNTSRQRRTHRRRSRPPDLQADSPQQQQQQEYDADHADADDAGDVWMPSGSDNSVKEEQEKGRGLAAGRPRQRSGGSAAAPGPSLAALPASPPQLSGACPRSEGSPPTRGAKQAAAQATKEARAEERERKRLAKEKEKEAKRLAREQAKLDKAATKQQEKLDKKEASEIQRALKGSNVERDMVLHMSGRLAEQPWGATLLHTLCEQGIEYRVDASPGPLSVYAWVRWGRRMHRAAAQAFMEAQGRPLQPPQQGGEGEPAANALAACSLAMELLPTNPDQPNEAELAFQLLLVFITPQDLVTQLLPSDGPHSGAGASTSCRGGLLHALRACVRAALPSCTLMVGCVSLARHLDALERAPGSAFNRTAVEDALLDLATRYPAVRLRTDLVDGAHAADVLVTTTHCLASHHKRQQDGYLKSFGTSRLPAMHGALEGASPVCRVTATALCHLLPPDKAVAVALKYQSMGGLMAAYAAQSTQRGKEEMLVGLSLDPGRGRALGKKASLDVYRYLHCTDPAAQAKDAPQDE